MKFDFVIGNPPYQEEIENKGDRATPVYNLFMSESYNIAKTVELITPARFLFDAGQTPKSWNKQMLADNHFRVLLYEPDSAKIFPTTEIKGGIAITIRNEYKDYGALKAFTPFQQLNTIIHKITSKVSVFVDSIVAPRGTYRVTATFEKDFPEALNKLGKGSGNMIVSNFFEKIPEAALKQADTNATGILCRVNGQRTTKYIKREHIRNTPFLDSYNLAVPEANGSGTFGERLTEGEMLAPNMGATDTFVSIGKFESAPEAKALKQYMKCKFFRALLGCKKVTQHCSPSVWQFVPLQDFTPNSDIDWSQPIPQIDQQLYKKYALDQSEIDFIETHVKEMA